MFDFILWFLIFFPVAGCLVWLMNAVSCLWWTSTHRPRQRFNHSFRFCPTFWHSRLVDWTLSILSGEIQKANFCEWWNRNTHAHSANMTTFAEQKKLGDLSQNIHLNWKRGYLCGNVWERLPLSMAMPLTQRLCHIYDRRLNIMNEFF